MATAPPAAADYRAAIKRAVRLSTAAQLTEDEMVDRIIAATSEKRLATTTAERHAEETARLLAEYDRLVAEGKAKSAVTIVAAKGETDRERENIARRIRKARRAREKKNGPGPRRERGRKV